MAVPVGLGVRVGNGGNVQVGVQVATGVGVGVSRGLRVAVRDGVHSPIQNPLSQMPFPQGATHGCKLGKPVQSVVFVGVSVAVKQGAHSVTHSP